MNTLGRQSRVEQLAYARGYNAGRNGGWPAHKPPFPPEPIVRRLMEAVHNMQAEADALRATFDPDDEVVTLFDRLTNEAWEARAAVEAWLLDGAIDKAEGGPS